jgi:WD40 repeat protein
MSFSPTSEMLAMTTSDSQLLIWNVNGGYMHKRSKYDNATLLTTSPDLQWLALITMRYCSDAQKHVQDALEVRELDSNDSLWTRTLDNRQALAMKISPDSRWLAVCYKDELHVYDGEGGTPRSWLWQFDLNTEPSDITPWRMEFSSDCALLLLLYCDHDYSIVVSDLSTGIQYKRPDSEHEYDEMEESINDAKFVPNTHLVMICDSEMCIYLWDFLKGERKEWLMNDYYVDCLAYSHAESWMATASHKEVILLCRDQRTLLRELELPDGNGLKEIEASYDDKKIAVCSRTTIWLLDVQIIIGAKPSSDEQEIRFPHILNDGVSIAYHDLFSKIEIENPIEGTITTLDIRNNVRENVNSVALSPEGRLLAYSDRSSIYIQDFDRVHLWYSFEVNAKAKQIAISPDISGDGQWIAVCTPFGVVVWDVDPGKFHRLIEFPDNLGRHPARAFFAGTQLAVSWCFHPLQHPDNLQDETLVFYDIKTCQPLAQLKLPCSWLLFDSPGGNFSMSPNGKWTVSYIFRCRRLLLSDVEAGIQYAVVDIDAKWFSFIDDSTLWTDQGVLSLDCVLDDLAVESRSGRTQIVEMDNQVVQELPLIIPTFGKYGRDASGEWITFDTHPLIWLPQQYRPNTVTHLGQMAIGHHHVTIESSRGTYSIVFTNDTGDYLRQAMDNLVI